MITLLKMYPILPSETQGGMKAADPEGEFENWTLAKMSVLVWINRPGEWKMVERCR